jgi:hypothetical protein
MEAEQEIPTGPCNYCGHGNPDRLTACPGCGNPYVTDTEPKQKSKGLAYFLAVVFGPIGLAYIKAWWPAGVLIILHVPFILTRTVMPWGLIMTRLFSLVTVWHHFSEDQPNLRRESNRLLEAAAKLEKTDRTAAIAAYREIARLYPETPASAEAERNIETLMRSGSSVATAD